ATILARGTLRNRLMRPAPGANGQAPPPTPAPGLPVITYSANSQLAFHMNGEDVQLIPIPNAHTDGDTMVRFVQNDVIMTGDFFRSVQYPNIDRGNGGGLNGMINGLGQIIARSGPNAKLITRHTFIPHFSKPTIAEMNHRPREPAWRRFRRSTAIQRSSRPQFFRCEGCAFRKRFQLRPSDLRVYAHAHSAVGAGDDILAA